VLIAKLKRFELEHWLQTGHHLIVNKMLKVALITLLVIATRTKDSIESLLLSFDPNDPNVILIEVKAARLCK
jgi:hypothetical protein